MNSVKIFDTCIFAQRFIEKSVIPSQMPVFFECFVPLSSGLTLSSNSYVLFAFIFAPIA